MHNGNKKIRVGVIGIGHLGTYHLQKYEKLTECAIVGVADSTRERADRAAETYGCESFDDHRGLVGMVDAVSIAVPTKYHYDVTKDFLAAGVDVLLEKPIAVNIEEADGLISLAKTTGAIFQIGFIERFNPAIVALKNVMDEPLFIEAHRLHPFFTRGIDVDVILDLMIHDLDIILSFVKSPLKNVEAVGVSVLSDNVDISNARITFRNGCVANVTASRVTGKVMQKIRFFGLSGYHSVDCGKRELMSLSRKNDKGTVGIFQNNVDVEDYDPLEREIRSFIHAVSTRTPPIVSGEEGRKSLELALQIIEKMNTGQGLAT